MKLKKIIYKIINSFRINLNYRLTFRSIVEPNADYDHISLSSHLMFKCSNKHPSSFKDILEQQK